MIDPALLVREITAELQDLAAEDRVFATGDGFVVKVKVFRVSEISHDGNHGHVAKCELVAAICGQDGKALRRADGAVAKWELGRTHHFKATGAADQVRALTDSCLLCVAEAVRAEKIRSLVEGHEENVPALVTRAEYQARKAAELVGALIGGEPLPDVGAAPRLDPWAD